ncbi:glycosyltransferase family 4 protein [uncultured Sulfitobacter sp.]|uniref:glycosyltransferase family 4 protein n=1 Tax=uncultured Sulfitobacter sp. TaxID=191468 RepID=UPI00263972FE|nr:glycosyltransferase family 4 protein [uncultured Sulfitobacter sp.]
MRVAVLAWGLPPHGSGLGRAAMEIARGLSQLGCDVTLFDSGRALGETVVQSGLAVVGCAPPTNGFAGFLRKRAVIGHLVAPWYFCKALREVHRECPFSIVEATNWYAPAAFLTTGSPALVVRNSTPAIDAKKENLSLRQRIDLWFAHKLEKQTAKKAAALISNTPSHAQVIKDIYNIADQPIHEVISLALDEDVLKRGAAAPLPSVKAAPSLLFVGRAERRKGFSEMLAGYACANQARRKVGRRPIRLTIVGVEPVDVTECLKAQGEDLSLCNEIEILNGLSDDDLYAEYEGTTAVIAPSRYESFGLVYREAAAFGRPLIACREDPAACDFIDTAECGILADTCTPKAIADAIERLFETPDDWDKFALAGRRHVQSLTVKRLAAKTLEVYAGVIALRSSVG